MSNPSTGPTSDAGKERSSLNAVKHGLRSERPVLPGEDAAEWDAFQAAIVADLAPGSVLETELAERVALQLWRLRRAARYEAQVAADQCETARHSAGLDPGHGLRPDLAAEAQLNDAFNRLRQLKDDLFRAQAVLRTLRELPSWSEETPIEADVAAELLGLLMPPPPLDEAPTTAGELREELDETFEAPLPELLALALRPAEEKEKHVVQLIGGCGERIIVLRKQLALESAARQHDSRLLQTAALDRVVRYEAHVSRQLNQALQLLRQFKDERRTGETPVPPEPTYAGGTAVSAVSPTGETPVPPKPTGEPPVPRQEADTTRSFGTVRRPASSVADRHDASAADGEPFLAHEPSVRTVIAEPPEARRNGPHTPASPDDGFR
jgi:hypothetical protein